MKRQNEPDTSELLRRSSAGETAARQQLLWRQRGRLHKLVALRLDRRLAARIDPSDVVQEVLADAAGELSDYLRRRPLPFYPWLRQKALDHLVELHRREVKAQKRSVRREERWDIALPNESALELVDRLVDYESTPSKQILRAELRERVRRALDDLPPRDCEILTLRHLEQLSMAEIAAILKINEGTAKVRHLRALHRLRAAWTDEDNGEDRP